MSLKWLLVAVAAGAGGAWWLMRAPPAPPSPPPPLVAIEKMGQLATLKLHYADIITFSASNTLNIPWTQWGLSLGGTQVLLVAKGDCTVATDLKAAQQAQVNPEARTLTLTLPAPKPLVVRINHASKEQGGSYFYAMTESGLERLTPGTANRTEAIDRALAHAQKLIEHSCTQPQVLADARSQAEAVLRPLYEALGWTVTFAWKA